jgi:hypothetical protein
MPVNESVQGNESTAITGTAAGQSSVGVLGRGQAVGVKGEGSEWNGVEGFSKSTIGGAGVFGFNEGGSGVRGMCKIQYNAGVHGVHEGDTGWGVFGEANNGTGVAGKSKSWVGVYGESESQTGGAGVWGKGVAGTFAGKFEGDVEVSGKIIHGSAQCKGDIDVGGNLSLVNADCAEQFDVAELTEVEPGTVMVLGEDGSLYPSCDAYDKRVVGVVSGAGSYRPAIVLDQRDTGQERRPIALLGKVYCKVDACFGEVAVGDLLTSSPTAGHAMKASDPQRAFGAVIGKALRPMREGQGLIPILIALQ